MLVYCLASGQESVEIREKGFHNEMYCFFDDEDETADPYVQVGVRVTDTIPTVIWPGLDERVDRAIVLALNVPEKIFAEHEFNDGYIEYTKVGRWSYIPAEALNHYGPPRTVAILE
jgi:hypothetical protein